MNASPFASHHPGQRAMHLYTDVGVQGAAASDNASHALIAMLFDGALGAIARARGAMDRGDTVDKAAAVNKALAIVGEGLRASLNLEKGGKLARDLDALYGYVEIRLTHANLRNDVAALDECAVLLKPLQEAWGGIAPTARQAA
jgi:flagellar protein FliS